jgi:hypothetical protein
MVLARQKVYTGFHIDWSMAQFRKGFGCCIGVITPYVFALIICSLELVRIM